jgi:hypothetical protein
LRHLPILGKKTFTEKSGIQPETQDIFQIEVSVISNIDQTHR